MEEILFLILPVYFIIGAIVTFTVNKHKGESERNHNWLKYSTYLLIVSGLFVSIIVNKVIFHFLGIVIILFGYGEIINLILRSRKFLTGLISLMAFTLAFYLFSQFTLLDNHQLFFVVMIVTVFDAFSQLAGQLLGKRKLVPEISPMKTFEGLAGGYLFAALTAIYIHNIPELSILKSIVMGFGVATSAFLGDLCASYFKRKFEVKDYSNLIPGHGGFLDRFDSLIFGGAFMYLIIKFL